VIGGLFAKQIRVSNAATTEVNIGTALILSGTSLLALLPG